MIVVQLIPVYLVGMDTYYRIFNVCYVSVLDVVISFVQVYLMVVAFITFLNYMRWSIQFATDMTSNEDKH